MNNVPKTYLYGKSYLALNTYVYTLHWFSLIPIPYICIPSTIRHRPPQARVLHKRKGGPDPSSEDMMDLARDLKFSASQVLDEFQAEMKKWHLTTYGRYICHSLFAGLLSTRAAFRGDLPQWIHLKSSWFLNIDANFEQLYIGLWESKCFFLECIIFRYVSCFFQFMFPQCVRTRVRAI